jgi:hypothetical protein
MPHYKSPVPLVPRYVHTPSPLKKIDPSSHKSIRTPSNKKPSQSLAPASKACSTSETDPYHVESDVEALEAASTFNDDMDWEREKMWWEAWRESEVLKVRKKIMPLLKERDKLMAKKFPVFEHWLRNRQMVTAAEGGLEKYSNVIGFTNLDPQLIAQELDNMALQAIATAAQHPAKHILRTPTRKRKKAL